MLKKETIKTIKRINSKKNRRIDSELNQLKKANFMSQIVRYFIKSLFVFDVYGEVCEQLHAQ